MGSARLVEKGDQHGSKTPWGRPFNCLVNPRITLRRLNNG